MSYVRVSNLSFRYSKRSPYVIKDISFSVEKGEFVALLGPNGSGKSTLGLILSGLEKESEGRVEVDGKEDIAWRRDRVRSVFQNPDNQIIGDTVELDTAYGPENMGYGVLEIRRRIEWALEETKLLKKKDSSPSSLSGGEKQRLALSSILSLEPECIVFDEATSMLDEISRAHIVSLAYHLAKDKGKTVFYITHLTDEIIFADKILILSGGRIRAFSTPREVLKYSLLKESNISIPYYLELSHQLKEMGLEIEETFNKEELLKSLLRIKDNGEI